MAVNEKRDRQSEGGKKKSFWNKYLPHGGKTPSHKPSNSKTDSEMSI
jgi:hypothetical protein